MKFKWYKTIRGIFFLFMIISLLIFMFMMGGLLSGNG